MHPHVARVHVKCARHTLPKQSVTFAMCPAWVRMAMGDSCLNRYYIAMFCDYFCATYITHRISVDDSNK